MESKSSRKEEIQIFISLCALVVSVVTLFSISIIITRDDATSLLLKGEKAFKAENYEKAYECFSSTLLYNNAISKAYLGYMDSNGLGCEQNILLGTKRYQDAIELGYSECSINLLYNTAHYSTCYYEIAEALLAGYDAGNADATAFLFACLHQTSCEIKNSIDLFQAKQELEEYFGGASTDRTVSVVKILQSVISDDINAAGKIKINTPLIEPLCLCQHEECVPYAECPLYQFSIETDYKNGMLNMYGTVFRFSFVNQEIIQQFAPIMLP